jgi:hypothetical protein
VFAAVVLLWQTYNLYKINERVSVLEDQRTNLQQKNDAYEEDFRQSATWMASFALYLERQELYYAAQSVVKEALERYPDNGELKALQVRIKQKINSPATKDYFLTLGRVTKWLGLKDGIANGAVIDPLKEDFSPLPGWVMHTVRVQGGKAGDNKAFKGEVISLYIPYDMPGFAVPKNSQ